MHYHAEVWIPEDGDIKEIEKHVSVAMQPYQEDESDDDTPGFWDWWQIGGRWTGAHDKYHPETDPANIEVCKYCGGTGTRRDMKVANGCNGCHGTGKFVKWPTEWVFHQDDIVNVKDVSDELSCHALILPETEPIMTHKWDGKETVKTDFMGNVKQELERRHVMNGYLVTVDYHS